MAILRGQVENEPREKILGSHSTYSHLLGAYCISVGGLTGTVREMSIEGHMANW